MSKYYATENCIVCGEPSEFWHGHVKAREKMALGNYIEKPIIAGFCKSHENTIKADESGCYGEYDNEKMRVTPFDQILHK